uniref:DNA 5'-3' helicase n=1 Tax=uncultured marine virus TaxID=186617 RepID=A0A0F7L9Z5_9VIRU|nr:replicative DNA helicase [uncultured marine virus]
MRRAERVEAMSRNPDATPNDIGAERALLGAAMMSPETMHTAAGGGLERDHFHNEGSRLMWDVLWHCDKRGAVDLPSVAGRLQDLGKLESIGGFSWLAGLPAACGSIQHVPQYAETVMRHSRARQTLMHAEALKARILGGGDPDEASAWMQGRLVDSAPESSTAEWASDTIERIRPQFSARSRPERFLPIRSRALRAVARGIPKAHTTVIVAPSRAGKSVLLEQLTTDLAFFDGIPGCMFALEMTCEEMMDRRISRLASINYDDVQDRTLSDDAAVEADNLFSLLDQCVLMTDDGVYTVHQICSRARAGIRRHDWQWVGIDHLHEIKKSDPNMSPIAHMQEVADALKELTKTTGIACLIAAQMNKDASNRKDPHPRIGDIRFGGPLEEKAALILGIHRDALNNPDGERKSEADVDALKARFARGGRAIMRWEGHFQRFADMGAF